MFWRFDSAISGYLSGGSTAGALGGSGIRRVVSSGSGLALADLPGWVC